MKAGNRLLDIAGVLKRPAYRDLAILYLLAIVGSAISFTWCGVMYYPDTRSYLDAWDCSLAAGRIDAFRMPVYPCLIGLMKLFMGENFGIGVVAFQYLVFFLSIKFFYNIAMEIAGSRWLTFVLTLFYLFPLMMWHNVIQTESLTLSLSVFILWSVLRLRSGFSVGVFAIFVISLVATVFMRPASLFLPPVLLLWWIFMAVKERAFKSAAYCAGYVVLVAISLFGYMKAFEKEYGLATVTKVSLVNQLIIVFDRDIMNPELIEDESLREDVKNIKGSYAEVGWLDWKYGSKTLSDMVMVQYRSQPLKCVKRTLEYIARTKTYPLYIANWPTLAAILDILGVNAGSFYIFMVFYSVFLLLWIVCHRKFPPPITLLLYSLGTANFLLVVLGAQNDWKRLMFTSYYPVYILLLGQICSILYSKRNIMNNIWLK